VLLQQYVLFLALAINYVRIERKPEPSTVFDSSPQIFLRANSYSSVGCRKQLLSFLRVRVI
jgi:hypothetical protein